MTEESGLVELTVKLTVEWLREHGYIHEPPKQETVAPRLDTTNTVVPKTATPRDNFTVEETAMLKRLARFIIEA